jgi:hypothetical protein
VVSLSLPVSLVRAAVVATTAGDRLGISCTGESARPSERRSRARESEESRRRPRAAGTLRPVELLIAVAALFGLVCAVGWQQRVVFYDGRTSPGSEGQPRYHSQNTGVPEQYRQPDSMNRNHGSFPTKGIAAPTMPGGPCPQPIRSADRNVVRYRPPTSVSSRSHEFLLPGSCGTSGSRRTRALAH